MPRVYFQIGTNNGNDNFRRMVQRDKPDLTILVEPNTNLINQIKHNYQGIPNVHIFNNAIYYTNDETVELVIPSKHGVIGARADNGYIYTDVNFSLVPMNDWGKKDDMVKIAAKTITFDEICRVHNISEIEYLQMDTEGFDTEIIKMIDFSKYKIKTLRYEKWGFDTSCFTEYNNDRAASLGKNGMDQAKQKLLDHNYQLSDIVDSDGNDIIARLKE